MKLRPELILRHVGGDYIIVDPGQEMVDMSSVFTLNDSAAFLWEALQEKEFTLDTVCDLLLEEYEVDEAQARQDAAALLAVFEEHNLLIK